jgi:hypothetical protein
MRWWNLSLLFVAVLAAGCGSDNDEVIVEEAPLGLVFSLPSAEELPTPYTGNTNLSATFNRATGLHEMQFSIFPTTTSGDLTTNPDSRRTWTWRDVLLEEEKGTYFWLIDGVNLGRWVNIDETNRVFLRQPIVIRIPSSTERRPGVGFAGSVSSTNPNVVASGTLVFALPIDSGFNPLDPATTFDPSTALGIFDAARGDDFVDLDANYRATLMPVDMLVLVVAVKDTNKDLYYSPADDWWGMHEVDGEFTAVFARLDTGEKDSLFNSGVGIVLRPPVAP